jgi:hypothetical protein
MFKGTVITEENIILDVEIPYLVLSHGESLAEGLDYYASIQALFNGCLWEQLPRDLGNRMLARTVSKMCKPPLGELCHLCFVLDERQETIMNVACKELHCTHSELIASMLVFYRAMRRKGLLTYNQCTYRN